MPARVLLVLSEKGVGHQAAATFVAAGYDALVLPHSMAALTALEGASRIELLVTCADFGPGQPNGIALTRMARHKRPGIRVLFIGEPGLEHYMDGLGAFLASPVDAQQIAKKAIELLLEDEQERNRGRRFRRSAGVRPG